MSNSTTAEVEVYRCQHWCDEMPSRMVDVDDYNGMTLSEAEADLRARGYVRKDSSGRGKANVLVIWAHPKSGIHWGLSAL